MSQTEINERVAQELRDRVNSRMVETPEMTELLGDPEMNSLLRLPPPPPSLTAACKCNHCSRIHAFGTGYCSISTCPCREFIDKDAIVSEITAENYSCGLETITKDVKGGVTYNQHHYDAKDLKQRKKIHFTVEQLLFVLEIFDLIDEQYGDDEEFNKLVKRIMGNIKGALH